MTTPLIQPWMYLIAAPLAAVGLIGLYCSLFKGRAKGRERCPKCWYDLKGVATPATCPECGRAIATRHDLLRTRRHWWPALVSLALIAPILLLTAKLYGSTIYYAVMPRWKAVEEVEWNGTTITRFQVRDPNAIPAERVLVRAGGNHVLDREDRSISLNGYNHSRETLIDLDNDDIKECVIESYSGGAHCCYRVYVVKLLAMGPQILADIDARNGLALKPPVAPEKEWLFDIPDQTFDYWHAPHAGSPMPSVLYRLQDGEFRIALDKMDRPAWTTAEFDAVVENYRRASVDPTSGNAPPIWGPMLERMYAGQQNQAWKLFEATLPYTKLDRPSFTLEFMDQLGKDLWYQDLAAAATARAADQPVPPAKLGASGNAP